MKRQTAVEFLVEMLEQTLGNSIVKVMHEEIDQAKEMEKEQIVEARATAPLLHKTDFDSYKKEAEDYYNETYGKR